jgi:hypothetical protein
MPLNKVHCVTNVDRVAAEPGETAPRRHDLAIGMEPEDGIIRVYGNAEIEILAFAPSGVENLIEMIAIGTQPSVLSRHGLHRMDTFRSCLSAVGIHTECRMRRDAEQSLQPLRKASMHIEGGEFWSPFWQHSVQTGYSPDSAA